jgi:ribosome-associated protein
MGAAKKAAPFLLILLRKIDLAKKQNTDDKDFALAAAKIAMERNCTDIIVLDLIGKSPATDYFVIATSTSDRQGRTVADEICTESKKFGLEKFGQAGYEQGRWILIDFVNVIVHIFDSEYRDYYNLEMLWGDASVLKTD